MITPGKKIIRLSHMQIKHENKISTDLTSNFFAIQNLFFFSFTSFGLKL